MNCERVNDELVAYLKGELEDPLRTEVATHLEVCSECREKVEGYRETLSAAAAIENISPSEGFLAALRSKLPAEPARRARSKRVAAASVHNGSAGRLRRNWHWIAAAASVTVAFVIAGLFIHPTDEELKLARTRRWYERQDAHMEAVYSEIHEDKVDVSGVMKSGTLFVLGREDPATGERCLVAYTASQIDELKKSGVPAVQLQDDANQIAAAAQEAQVADGLLTLPSGVAKFLSTKGGVQRSEATVALEILKLQGRTEIWARPVLTKYLEVKPAKPAPPPQKPG